MPRPPATIGGFHFCLLVLVTGSVACMVAMLSIGATLDHGHYVPVGNDSFYHGRRILDAMAGNFYQFDSHIHAPEGSWLTWPWAYDWLMAQAARTLCMLGGWDAMAVLAHVAPAWAFVNAALFLGVAVALGLRPLFVALAGVSFALSPLTQSLHAIGMLDHHFMEYTFVLAALLTTIQWMRAPESRGRAFACGAVLGAAPAFHNGLFVLQLPVALTLFVTWLRHGPLVAGAARAFTAGLAALSVAALLPSGPFWDGQFSFCTLSWFHAYVATATGLGVLFLAWQPPSPRTAALLLGACALASLPLLREFIAGMGFIEAVHFEQMNEAISIPARLARGGLGELTRAYGALIVLLPIGLLYAVRPLVQRGAPPERLALAAFSLLGAVFLCFQYRLHYYGSFALVLPLLLWSQERAMRHRWMIALPLLAVTGSAAASWPVLNEFVPLGQDVDYELTHRIYPAFAAACAKRSGIVLADNNDGHYIRFHTDCSVIADNFIMTAQHHAKVLEAARLLAGDSRDLVARHPEIGFVYVRREDNIYADQAPAEVDALNRGLRKELLFPGAAPAPEFKLIAELRLAEARNGSDLLARLYRIDRSSSSTSGQP